MPEVFWKQRSGDDAVLANATELAGLDWLRVPGGPPVPPVVARRDTALGITRIPPGRPDPSVAHTFGARLAALHRAGAPAFGSPPPDAPGPHGWIGDLPMSFADRATFSRFWALDRVAATARLARDRGGLTTAQTRAVERFVTDLLDGEIDCGPAEPVARLHGDLWSGNVLWGRDGQAWLIDPAAHGGHRESDLAMLAQFGAPDLEHILAGYQQVAPLAPGWRDRVALHQVWPLLVHAALFRGGYGASAVQAVRRAYG